MNHVAAPGTGRLGTGKTVNTTCGGARFSNLQHAGVSSVIPEPRAGPAGTCCSLSCTGEAEGDSNIMRGSEFSNLGE